MNPADLLAFITILVWPAVPLFWVPVLVFLYRDVLLGVRVELPVMLRIAGLVLVGAGTILHLWTGELLGFKGLIGLPEISSKVKSRLVTNGPFSVVRHPTYLAHTLLFAGVFLITEVVAVGIVTLLDFIVINAVVMPLEDRELEDRFAKEYEDYKKRVPGFFPQLFRKNRD
jgi:protein-S-isoprenylcysteine O-methyltransferase Ste14